MQGSQAETSTLEEETHAEGLEEGQQATEAGQEDTTKGNGESEEQIEEPTTDKAEGLKEGQEPGAGEEEKEEEEKPEEEQQAPGLKEGQAGNPGGGNKKRWFFSSFFLDLQEVEAAPRNAGCHYRPERRPPVGGRLLESNPKV